MTTAKTIRLPKELELNVQEDIQLKDNGEDAKSAPIVMLARTKKKVSYRFSYDEEPIDILHDFSGMKHKNRIPIDFNHDSTEVIGYINKFNIGDEGLTLGGAITPFGTDKGAEIVHKHKQGVPYQASIMTGGESVIEFIDGDSIAQVNGETISGPVLIFREWELTGVAVVRHGADDMTQVIMSKKKEGIETEYVNIELTNKNNGEIVMEKEQVEAEKAVDTVEETVSETTDNVELSAVEAEQVETPQEEVVEAEPVAEVVDAVEETPAEETEVKDEVESEETEAEVEAEVEAGVETKEEEKVEVKLTGEDYMNTFGETKGAYYFAKGYDLDKSYKEHIAHLTTELEKAQATAKELEAKVEFKRGNDAVELSLVQPEVGMTLEDLYRKNK